MGLCLMCFAGLRFGHEYALETLSTAKRTLAARGIKSETASVAVERRSLSFCVQQTYSWGWPSADGEDSTS